MATTTLAGNSGNNLLNASGLESTLVQGLQGNDTIGLARLDDSAQAGSGNDSIGFTRTGTQANNVAGGLGNDSITFNGALVNSQTIAGGDGNDLITIGSVGSTALVSQIQIAGNQGNDTVVFGTANNARTIADSYIGLGQGNDSIRFGSATTLTSSDIFGGKGKDTIALAGVAGASSTINGGEGADILNFAGAGALTTAKIGAGRGGDSINFGTGALSTITGSVAGGGLNDTITFAGGLAAVEIFGDANGVTTVGTGTDGAADGADLIGSLTSDANGATINGGGGADSIYLQNTTGLIRGGNGSDSIVIASGGANSDASINGGAGTDVIRINTNLGTIAATDTINGGDGNDTLEFAGTVGVTFTAGGGNVVNSGNFNMIVDGAASGDVIKLSNTGGFAATTADNWLNANNPTLFVYTGLGDNLTANGGVAGGIGVYSDGTDTYFVMNGATTAGTSLMQFYRVLVKGVDLVNTTRSNGQIALNSTNFGFTLGLNNTTNNTGLVITLS